MHPESDTPLPVSKAANTATVDLVGESLTVSRDRVAGDLVRLSTSTRTREHVVDEALTHEDVIVERVAVGRIVDAVPEIRVEGDTTIVPVVKEEIVVHRRLVLTEEVHMRRVPVTGRHRETVILREQVAEVTRIGAGHSDATTNRNIPEGDTTTTTHPRSHTSDR